jgi:hypothetical protein
VTAITLINLRVEGSAMSNDLVAMREALLRRGFRADEVMSLEGRLDRNILMTFLQQAKRRIAADRSTEVFFYYGGHGGLTGNTVAEARPGLFLTNDAQDAHQQQVFWDEVFAALDLPAHVRMILLPDT